MKKHEAAASDEDICVPSLFSYTVPEDKNSADYEEKRKQRLNEIEGICKSGPSNLCRSSTVWKGNKEKEEQDRKWAEEKLRLLRAERNTLRDGYPTEAKKWNYKMKVHEKDRLVPDTKRKDVDKTGSSPNNKFIKTTTHDSKLPLTIGNQS